MGMNGTLALAEGTVTTWAGTTRVWASERGVRRVDLPDWHASTAPADATATPRLHIGEAGSVAAGHHLRQALDELAEFFVGERRVFTVALDAQGTPFYLAAWQAVARVPYGETRSYGEIARELGLPRATRAVGAANGANPVAPFVPCHRVLGSSGHLHGYGPGLALKQRLLLMEDALPASAEDTPAWLARVAARRGGAPFVLGMRAAGVYCAPGCSTLLRRLSRPPRIFATAAAASAAGFAPCPLCHASQRPVARSASLGAAR